MTDKSRLLCCKTGRCGKEKQLSVTAKEQRWARARRGAEEGPRWNIPAWKYLPGSSEGENEQAPPTRGTLGATC